jgi:hypothetical protein
MKVFKTSLLVLFLLCSLNLSAKTDISDTLRIVRDDEFLRYPFGVFHKFEAFKNQDIKAFHKAAFVRPYKDGGREHTVMFTFLSSYARFYLDRKTKKLETVNAIIQNKEMPLQNGVMIGMGRTDFLKKMGISGDDDTKANIVELSSKTEDIHHYYNFQNDRLVRITILSKLFYQKA